MKHIRYVCPMHPDVVQDKPGTCPKCGMKLVLETEVHSADMHHGETQAGLQAYTPLIIIIGLITIVTVVLTVRDALSGSYALESTMRYFMAGFFLVFSGFKLL